VATLLAAAFFLNRLGSKQERGDFFKHADYQKERIYEK
jgi:hypothetical protein